MRGKSVSDELAKVNRDLYKDNRALASMQIKSGALSLRPLNPHVLEADLRRTRADTDRERPAACGTVHD